MPDMIRDGRGRGYLASVNADNQLVTRSVVLEQRLLSAIDNNYYEATTGIINLANAAETGVIYIKNEDTERRFIVIDRVFYDMWTSTGGSGADGILRYYINPTITGGTAIVPNNTNFDSSRAAQGTFSRSLTTMTGTAWWTAYITDKTSTELNEGRIVIPTGRSFGISIAAPTGNTSMNLSINVAFFYFDKTLVQGE